MAFSPSTYVTRTVVLFSIFYVISCEGSGKIIKLDEENWTQMLEGEWMVEFFAPWCPACRVLEPTWIEFADWSKDLDIQVAQVDVTVNPGMSGRFLVTALPTIFHVIKGQFRQYRGTRDKDHFISFIEDKKWESTEELPGWKAPDSILMSLISYFFKLSMFLRSVHTKLIEEYGVPYWGSYLIFALSTIVVGAIFGLILVCVIDFVFPPKASLPPILAPSDETISTQLLDTKPESADEDEKASEKVDEKPSEEPIEELNDHAQVEDVTKGSDDKELKDNKAEGNNEVRQRHTAKVDN